jgi:hypothetical protein
MQRHRKNGPPIQRSRFFLHSSKNRRIVMSAIAKLAVPNTRFSTLGLLLIFGS